MQNNSILGHQNKITDMNKMNNTSSQTSGIVEPGRENDEQGTAVKFTPIDATEPLRKGGILNIRHQSITCMEEYETKSFEELRIEDYDLNRKGDQQQLLATNSQLFYSIVPIGSANAIRKRIKPTLGVSDTTRSTRNKSTEILCEQQNNSIIFNQMNNAIRHTSSIFETSTSSAQLDASTNFISSNSTETPHKQHNNKDSNQNKTAVSQTSRILESNTVNYRRATAKKNSSGNSTERLRKQLNNNEDFNQIDTALSETSGILKSNTENHDMITTKENSSTNSAEWLRKQQNKKDDLIQMDIAQSHMSEILESNTENHRLVKANSSANSTERLRKQLNKKEDLNQMDIPPSQISGILESNTINHRLVTAKNNSSANSTERLCKQNKKEDLNQMDTALGETSEILKSNTENHALITAKENSSANTTEWSHKQPNKNEDLNQMDIAPSQISGVLESNTVNHSLVTAIKNSSANSTECLRKQQNNYEDLNQMNTAPSKTSKILESGTANDNSDTPTKFVPSDSTKTLRKQQNETANLTQMDIESSQISELDESSTASIELGTPTNFTPTNSTETLCKGGVLNIRYQSITCMKNYETKSFEELRIEDYELNRKGLQLSSLETMNQFSGTSFFNVNTAITYENAIFGQTCSDFGKKSVKNTFAGKFNNSRDRFGANSAMFIPTELNKILNSIKDLNTSTKTEQMKPPKQQDLNLNKKLNNNPENLCNKSEKNLDTTFKTTCQTAYSELLELQIKVANDERIKHTSAGHTNFNATKNTPLSSTTYPRNFGIGSKNSVSETGIAAIGESASSKSEDRIYLKPVYRHTGIILSDPEYYTIPSLDELVNYLNEDGSCFVEGFSIGRYGYGHVYFPDTFDVSNLNLDEVVHFSSKKISIYPDKSSKPPIGQGLNRRAQVTLHKFWPRDNKEKSFITDVDILKKIDFASKLRKRCEKQNAQFVDYIPQTGSWLYTVDHF